MSDFLAAIGSQSFSVGCLARARTWTFLIQSQTCCQLHHEAIGILDLTLKKIKDPDVLNHRKNKRISFWRSCKNPFV
jgi:hypothetical protein